jgi:hypothetical protein
MVGGARTAGINANFLMKTPSATITHHWNSFNQLNLSIALIVGTLLSDQIPSARRVDIVFSADEK